MGDNHAVVLMGINVGFLATSSYVDPTGFRIPSWREIFFVPAK
jgi:hypothetical protein